MSSCHSISQPLSQQPTEEGYLWDFRYLIKLGEGEQISAHGLCPIGFWKVFSHGKMRSSAFLSFFIKVWSYLNLIPPSKLFASSVKFFLWCADDVANVAYLSRQNVLQKESDENSFTGFLFFKVQTFLINFVISFFSDPSAKFLLWFASFFPKYFPEKRCFLFSTKSQVIGLYQFFFENVFFSNCLFEREETQTSWSELSLWHRQTLRVRLPVVSVSCENCFLATSYG